MTTMRKLYLLATAPYRALCHARDLYVKSLGGCAGKAQRPPFAASMPRSRSRAAFLVRVDRAGQDDFGELIRAASARTSAKARAADGATSAVSRRSQSVTMRIDEERPCGFDDVGGGMVGLVGIRQYPRKYPRSRSCTVGSGDGRAVSQLDADAAGFVVHGLHAVAAI